MQPLRGQENEKSISIRANSRVRYRHNSRRYHSICRANRQSDSRQFKFVYYRRRCGRSGRSCLRQAKEQIFSASIRRIYRSSITANMASRTDPPSLAHRSGDQPNSLSGRLALSLNGISNVIAKQHVRSNWCTWTSYLFLELKPDIRLLSENPAKTSYRHLKKSLNCQLVFACIPVCPENRL